MEKGVSPAAADIIRLIDCIERLITMMEYDFSKILWPMLIYAEKYVKITAPVTGAGLFPLLVVSASVATKMWEDYGPDLELTAHVCGISKREISYMERDFLQKLHFNLNLQMKDLDAFQAVPLEALFTACAALDASPRMSGSS